MEIKKKPEEIFKEYQKDQEYKSSLGLYDAVDLYNKFYHGEQWDGVNAPDIQKITINILKPAIKYYVSMIVSDDIGISIEDFDDEGESQVIEDVIKNEVNKVFERNRFNYKTREYIKSTAIDGDGCMYIYMDDSPAGVYSTQEGEQIPIVGNIKIELVDNTRVHFANPAEHDVNEQPYIILSFKKYLDDVKAEAKERGLSQEEIEKISDDNDEYNHDENNTNKYATVMVKLFKDGGTVKFIKCTKDVILIEETDTEIDVYPVIFQSWEKKKRSYHGVSSIKAEINNQIFINQIFSMAMQWQKMHAFPKIIYDKRKIKNFDNRIGVSLGIDGDPRESIFESFASKGMNNQAIELANLTIDKTKDVLGVFDAALGNVKPDNTSAIIAVQRAASQPLELQKMDFYQMIEDAIRVIVKLMGTYYGIRPTKQAVKTINPMTMQEEFQTVVDLFDFSQVMDFVDRTNVEIGGSSYWSELTQVQTLDNLMQMQIIPDALTYLEAVPDGYIKNKQKIIDRIKEIQQPPVADPSMGPMPPTPQGGMI